MLSENRLSEIVTVEKLTVTTATDGQTSKAWAPQRAVWVEFKDARGKEFMAAHQLNNKITHVVSMRCYSGLTAKEFRFKKGSRVWNLASVVNPREADEEMLVTCIEAV